MKPLKLLFIIDPLESFHIETDTTFVIMAEACQRGHEVWTTTVDELHIKDNAPYTQARKTHITNAAKKDWSYRENKTIALEEMQFIFMRKDPPFNIDYIMVSYMLSLVNTKKTFIANSPEALRNYNEKMIIFQFPQYIAKTIVAKRAEEILDFIASHKEVVIKPLEGFGGQGVFILRQGESNAKGIIEMMSERGKRFVMVQKYLPAVKTRGDTRVLILDGKILGAHKRVAAADDHRSNISAGGSSYKGELTKEEIAMCEDIAEKLPGMGIYFAGLDVIGGKITEINITSPTGLVKMNEHDGTRLEKSVVDFIENKIKNL